MIVHALRLLSFRAHNDSRVELAPKVNLIYGPNGAGKTNVLEAIHYLCLSKSFIASQDTYVLRRGCPFFEVEGRFEGRQRPELLVRLVYVPDEGKRILVNRVPLDRLSAIVGMLPVVVFSPEDQAITAGGPDERRRFLNNILSQARPVYLDDLLKYRRALRQRNALLTQYRKTRQQAGGVLASWDEELITLGSRIIARRLRFIQTFSRFLEEAYRRIESVGEKPTMTYASVAAFAPDASEADISERYRTKMKRVATRERELGRTLLGPHRDELVFRLNDFEVRRYASQGQHRTFGMAIKLAKYFYLKDRLEEPPILLLDDVFGNLDARRSEIILNLLQTDAVGQSIITSTDRKAFSAVVPFEQPQHRAVAVDAGQIKTYTEERP